MKPQDFLKEYKRMCKRDRKNGKRCQSVAMCSCNLSDIKPEEFAQMYDAVAEWSDTHPVKTRQSEFLEMFPNADLTRLLPCHVEKDKRPMRCAEYGYLSITCRCDMCRDDYWNEEVSE